MWGKTKPPKMERETRVAPPLTLSCLTLFLIALLALGIPPSLQSGVSNAASDDASVVSTSTREGRLAVFDDFWETIQERYYDPTFRGIDWTANRASFRREAADASGSQEFYEVLRQMIRPLKDAHTRVYSPEEKFDWWNPRFVTVGLTVREIDGVPTVVQVEPKSAPAEGGIRPGDVIVNIDGVSAPSLLERRLKNSITPPDASDRFRAFSTLLDGLADTSIKLVWQQRDGKTKSAIFQRHWTQRRLGVQFHRKGKLLIIEFQAFTQAIALDFARSMPKLIRGVDGIVLDLRANGGGDAEAMAEVASAFLGDAFDLGRFVDRWGASFELHTNSRLLWPAAPLAQTKLPLVVLTSENTSSAAEILVAALQTKRRAQVIGTETCGCVLAIRSRHSLPDSGLLDVSEFDYRTAEGVRLQDAGIKPHETVMLNRGAIYSRRDQAMESARIFLKNSSGK
jgi:carboxyl-terminal processing protease